MVAAGSTGDFEDHGDVGVVTKPGAVVYDEAKREYTVTAGGENIWGNRDAFHFVWRKVSGDVDLSAAVRFVGAGKDPHRKACLMVRQGLETEDAYADVAVHGDGLISLQYRSKKGGPTSEVKSTVKGPAALRLVRGGDRFTATVTPEGKPPAETGPVTVELRGPVYVGLAVSAHDATVTETVVFANVRLKTP
jgi:hypothetical protein